MSRLFLLFNHRLTAQQEDAAREQLRIEGFVMPPEHILKLWGQVPADLPQIGDVLTPVVDWLESEGRAGDFVLIQGDFGACFWMVQAAFHLQLIPIYATTCREATENHLPDGSIQVVHHFRHVLYRRYERWPEKALRPSSKG